MMKWKSKYFYGTEVSRYGQEHNRVDYRTLASAFEHVLNNDIMGATEAAGLGYWEQESGYIDNREEIEELEEQIEILEENEEENTDQIEELREQIEELEAEQEEQPEIYQYYIVSDNGAEILEKCNEIVFYNSTLDMYIWGVTHWGTSWDYVLTDIEIETA